MKSYIGTKIVTAEPCDSATPRQAEENQIAIEKGYKVQYEDGYTSWSPKEVFERCYREITDQEKKRMLSEREEVDNELY